MKKLIVLFFISLIYGFVFSQVNPNHHYVKSYIRKDGTYVTGHYRTNPNNTNVDNYSTKPNINPYTGKKGYIEPDNNYLPSINSLPHSNLNSEVYGGNSYSRASNKPNWDEIKAENERWMREEYPKFKAEHDRWMREEYPKLKADQERWMREEFPKLKEEGEELLKMFKNTNGYLKNNSYENEAELAIKYHYKYSIDDRKIIESALANLGYSVGVIDGVFDSMTIEAIRQFQSNMGMSQDGKVGANTLIRLSQQLNK